MKILKNKNQYFVIEDLDIDNTLPIANFKVCQDEQMGVYIQKEDDISIPEKIYSNDSKFIEHVLKSIEKEDVKQTGILLIGKKGLGKSLTGNIIAQRLQMPIIRVTERNNYVLDFVKKIKQDVILFIDEMDKLYSNSNEYDNNDTTSQNQFLSFLNGGMEFKYKLIFIGTGNDSYKINDFLKDRPSRIRYYRTYNQLDEKVIKEIIDDLLVNKEFEKDLLTNIPYEHINIDALIQIIEEINYHNEKYSDFKEFFNFKKEVKENISLYTKEGNGLKIYKEGDEVVKGGCIYDTNDVDYYFEEDHIFKTTDHGKTIKVIKEFPDNRKENTELKIVVENNNLTNYIY